MKKFTLLLILLFAINFGYGQTTLTEGDIVITGVNTKNPDQFSFVLLTDILNGTEINFTDCGWLAIGEFRSYNPATGSIGEGIVTWTADADLTCGTEIIITDLGSNLYSSTNNLLSTPIGTASETEAGFGLTNNGADQVIAYQGTVDSPSFLYAVHLGNASGWTDGINIQNSAVPAGLTAGVNAIDLGDFDNSSYLCTETSNKELILETLAIVNTTNWEQNNSTGSRRPILGGCTFNPCSVSGSCASTVTWNGAWVGGMTPDLSTEVIIAANYSTSLNSFNACSLTINSGVTLTVENGTHVTVQNDVIVDGNLIVQTQGNFVQNDNSGTFNVNLTTGSAIVNKQTSPKSNWFFYTYWSSPVVGETIENVFPLVDADRRFFFEAANFVDNTGDDIDDNNDDWEFASGIMTPGVGYACTEASLFPGGIGNATFEGVFNTGDIPVDIFINPTNMGVNWNFIGNPYPSAIDFVAFQQANSTVVEGAAYFWSQASPPVGTNPGNEVLNFNLNDYAVFTVGTGGAAGGVPLKIPNGFVASGQGFFIPALNAGNVTFTNAMRMADDTSNNQFFKGSNSKKSSNTDNLENKLWLNLTSGNGIFNQILVGYVSGATDNNDGMSYDAPKLLSQDYAAALYTLMDSNDAKYVIQGKGINSINESETIQLGFNTNVNVATVYKLSVAQLEGDFLINNTVFLKDNLLNTVHDLSSSDYTFTSEVGEFKERFEIVFNANALSTEGIAIEKKSLKIIELEDDNVLFTASNTIKTVRIFDLLGRQLYNLQGQSNSETYKLSNLSSAIYIAKVELSNGAIITKKAFKK